MKLALFDLDHTLVPYDSGLAWLRFLAGRGVLGADVPERYLAACQAYVAGTLDLAGVHHALVAPLAGSTLAQRAAWGAAFEAALRPTLPAAMRSRVQRHQDDGALGVLVTATTRLVAEPFARAFGLGHVIATEAREVEGRLDGTIEGLPCHGAQKLVRVAQWLAGRPDPGTLAACERSWFYSDAFSDLPLLQAVGHPVAVRPDERLRAHARHHGWPIVDDDEP